MSEITLTSEITVRLVQQCGGDHMVVAAAKVSTSGEEALKWAGPVDGEAKTGLINYLVKSRHGTTTEHGLMTFFVHAPAFVWWEWIRHRVGMTVDCPELSFNLESGRYKVLDPVFWIPRPDRKMTPARDHKSARPKFEAVGPSLYARSIERKRVAYQAAWEAYQDDIDDGIANEVARTVLGFGVYYSGWVSCNPRSLMSFLSLRTHEPDAKFPSFPLAEIEEAARVTERIFATYWPVTYQTFCDNGRVGP